MKSATLELICCPTCHGNLFPEIQSGNGNITTGQLICSCCKKSYPLHRGIPQFIREEELEGLNKPFSHMYDWFSWIYTAFSKIGFLFLGTTDSHARREVLARLEPNGGRVLEVSIGPGVNLPFLINSSSFSEIYGLDISIGQLNRCKSLINRKG